MGVDVSRLGFENQYLYGDSKGVGDKNQNDDDKSVFLITQDKDYQNDTQQLMEDRNYFNQLSTRLQNGDMEAFQELEALSAGAFVDGNDVNAKLYNENTRKIQQMKQENSSENFFMKEA